MNPFKTLGHWLWRWWTGREFWEPSGPRPGESLSEWLRPFRNRGKLVHFIVVDEPTPEASAPNPLHEAALDVMRGTFKGPGMFNPAGAPFAGQTLDDVNAARYAGPKYVISPATIADDCTISIKINDAKPDPGGHR